MDKKDVRDKLEQPLETESLLKSHEFKQEVVLGGLQAGGVFVDFVTISLELISLNSHLRTDVKGRK